MIWPCLLLAVVARAADRAVEPPAPAPAMAPSAGAALPADLPPAWRAPVELFLSGSIEAPALRQELLAADPRPAASDPTAATVRGPVPIAARYAELEKVLAGLLPEDAPALAAARRLAARLSGSAGNENAALPFAGGFGMLPCAAVSERMAADLLEIELPYLVEAQRRLKLEAGGAIALDEGGFPDADSYLAASKAAALLADPASAAAVPAADRAALERLRSVYERTRAALFSGHNERALTARYAEPTPGGKTLTIADYVRSERFKTPKWWVWSSQHSREAPHGYAAVTADRAASPFLKELGPGAFSTIYWAARPGDDFGRPDPEGMRVRVNADRFGEEHLLEVLAPIGREDDGRARWEAFFFKKIGGEWVPGDRLKLPKERRCINCHYRLDSDGKPRLTPIPTVLKIKARFLAVGYEDTALLASYLETLASSR